MYSVLTTPRFTRADGSVCIISNGYSPLYFDLQRQDTPLTGIFDFGGNLGVVVNDNTIFTQGNKAYISYIHSTGTFTGAFDILLVTNIVIGFVTFPVLQLDTAFVPHVFVSGFANSFTRTGYKIRVQTLIGTDTTTERDFTPDNTGLIRVYLNSMIQDYFDKHDIDYTVINEVADELVLPFIVQAKEIYSGVSGTYSNILIDGKTSPLFAAKAVAQLGENNLMETQEVYYESPTAYSTAVFLTAFEKPVQFEGFPFSLSFLKGVSSLIIQRVVVIAGVPTVVDLPVQTSNQIHTLPLSVNASEFTVYLQTGSTSPSFSGYATEYAKDYVL